MRKENEKRVSKCIIFQLQLHLQRRHLFENRDHLDFKMSCFPNDKQVLSKKIIKTNLLGTLSSTH